MCDEALTLGAGYDMMVMSLHWFQQQSHSSNLPAQAGRCSDITERLRGLCMFGGQMKEIPLTQGYVAIVDDEDFPELSKHKWYAVRMRSGVKAACWRNGKHLYMHRAIMKAKDGQPVDHRNHNTLDNQRSNIRLCTHSQNRVNQRKRPGCSSRYKGVYWHKGNKRWRAQIEYHGNRRCLRGFINENDAARAYNAAATELFGEFALLNEVK